MNTSRIRTEDGWKDEKEGGVDMQGNDIPMETVIISGRGGIKTEERPLYTLVSEDEAKRHQDKLGKNAGWYYGVNCKKCHGVYPKHINEQNFRAFAYYLCPVCGKESKHCSMPWEAEKAWNNDEFEWAPKTSIEEGYQFSIFDL